MIDITRYNLIFALGLIFSYFAKENIKSILDKKKFSFTFFS